jgi:ribonuclease HI
VGSRAHGARHSVCPPNGNQILGIGGFRGGMDGNTTTACPNDPGALEHILQWLLHPQQGIVLIFPKGDQILYMIRLYFRATNNMAEYEALVNNLHIGTELGVQRLYICGDSELIINQVMGESNCRSPCMVAYRQEVRKLKANFDGFELHYIL